jgi:hypothetical protein
MTTHDELDIDLMCTGRSPRFRDGLIREALERARVIGKRVQAVLKGHPGVPSSGGHENLSRIWDRPLPDLPIDEEFATRIGANFVRPVTPLLPRQHPSVLGQMKGARGAPGGCTIQPQEPVERVRLIVTDDLEIDERLKEYL